MFSAELVTGSAYFVITTLVGMVIFMVSEADRIENQASGTIPSKLY